MVNSRAAAGFKRIVAQYFLLRERRPLIEGL